MNKIIRNFFILALLFSVGSIHADVLKPVKWEKSIKKTGDNEYEIVFKAKIDKGWHMYGLDIPEGGPVATSFNFDSSNSYKLLKTPVPSIEPEKLFDSTFEMELELFNGTVSFTQKVKLLKNKAVVKGYIEFMSCDNSRCLPPSDENFEFTLIGNKTALATAEQELLKKNVQQSGNQNTKKVDNSLDGDTAIAVENTQTTVSHRESKITSASDENMPLWQIFWKALAKGILAVFTPCVWPIIPLTVAFFMRDNSTGKRIFQALFFGFSIVAIYTSVGLLAGLAHIDIVELSKHWLTNLIISLILILVAASFFGMFEIVLPGSLSNKLDRQVDKGGVLAPFFLALVTAVVSFSCVGPVAGWALGAALTGKILISTVAMLGFSISFAFPFVLIGIFPELLKKLPKSGGWLNSVKVVFAFIVLAASLIFLGNTQWKIFNRDVVLSLEIVIFGLLGYYLLGKIKFAHDSDLPYIKVPRLILAIISFAIAVYLIPGMFGSPLKAVSAFLPPPETSGFSLKPGQFNPGSSVISKDYSMLCDPVPKYSGFLTLPLNLTGYFDYDEGIACAKELNKPVLLDFAGHTCKNCKKMYAEVWADNTVLNKLHNDFVIIALYTDERKKLPENEWFISKTDGNKKTTIGAKNLELEFDMFTTNALPLYAIIDADGNVLTKEKYYTYNSDIEAFLNFLNEGISNFKQKK